MKTRFEIIRVPGVFGPGKPAGWQWIVRGYNGHVIARSECYRKRYTCSHSAHVTRDRLMVALGEEREEWLKKLQEDNS